MDKTTAITNNTYDNVEKPYHYNWLQMEVIDIIFNALTPEEFEGYLKGNIIKYSLRAGFKDKATLNEDLAKRNKYLDWLLEFQKMKRQAYSD